VKQIEQRVALEEVGNKQLIETYENTLKVKKRQLEKMTVRAHFDGVVSQVYARPGDLIGAGSPLALIISTSRTVEAKISEENFAGIRIGQAASVRFLGYGSQLYDAKVTKILPTADPLTQRYIVHLEVQIEPEKLVPGITGEVSIVVGERPAEAIVPRRAVFGRNVYVVEDGRVHLREVELGYESVTAAEILKGLKAGEQVIVDQLDTFRDGDRVRVEVVPAR
jgi:RND family efflux transporter MFP subunit